MTRRKFKLKVGRFPNGDDLERVNCKSGNKLGHRWCGWCKNHDKPRFVCGCCKIKFPRMRKDAKPFLKISSRADISYAGCGCYMQHSGEGAEVFLCNKHHTMFLEEETKHEKDNLELERGKA